MQLFTIYVNWYQVLTFCGYTYLAISVYWPAIAVVLVNWFDDSCLGEMYLVRKRIAHM